MSETTPSVASPPVAVAGRPGMDPTGLSALVLMSSAKERQTVVFLTLPHEATLQNGATGEARVLALRLDEWTRLPLATATVDCLVVDLDLAPAHAAPRRVMLDEIRRVLRPRGTCIVVVAHRRRPRNPRDVLGYRLVPPLRGWVPLFGRTGLFPRSAATVRFDETRLVEFRPSTSPVAHLDPSGDAAALALTRGREPADPTVLEAIAALVEGATGHPCAPERIAVRKIGKTIALFRSGQGQVVVRIARSPVALGRAARNHDALSSVRHRAPRAGGLLALLPRPIVTGRVGGYGVFAEERLPGTSGVSRGGSAISWEPQALGFITRLHQDTARRTVLTDAAYQRLVGCHLSLIASYCESDDQRMALRALSEWLRISLAGRELPLVRTHGDFTRENCLYDDAGRLCGVIDWELSADEGLPLLDPLQLMDIMGESNAHARWQRADVVLDAAGGTGPLATAPEIDEYATRLAIDRALMPALLLLHWVDHVGCRIEARAVDPAWRQKRVRQPLERIGEIALRGLSERLRPESGPGS